MKKLLSLLMALMMFAMPALAEDIGIIGGADGPTDVLVTDELMLPSGKLTQDALAAGRRVVTNAAVTEIVVNENVNPPVDAVLTDLLNALAVSVAVQGDEGEFSLKISDRDVLSLGGAVSGDNVYLKSNLLGGTVVVKTGELEGLLDRLLEMVVMVSGMSEEEAASMREQIAMLKEQYGETAAVAMDSVLSEDDMQQLDFSAIQALLSFEKEKTQPVESIVVPRMCDPAVSGEMTVISNAEMAQAMKYFYQFLLDNPKLMNYVGSQLGFPSEAEIELMWESYGSFYTMFGIYESKEAYMADNPSFQIYLNELMADLDTRKVLDGEMTIAQYYDADGKPVYVTMSLPAFIDAGSLADEASEEAKGETTNINMVYTRQTVAAGVAHVATIDIDGETLTIDVLENDRGMTIALTGVNIARENSDGIPEKLLNVDIKRAAADDEAGMELLAVTGTVFDGENPVMDFLLDASWLFNDARSYYGGTLTLTNYSNADATVPAQAENDSLVAEEPAVEAPAQAQEGPVKNTIVLGLSSDYHVNGVDFTGKDRFFIEVDGVKMVIEADTVTTDPVDSMTVGSVVRPAELNDGDFANWFVGVYSTIERWPAMLLQALPESVLTMLLTGGMM